jgi:hypothetical protein
VPEGLAAHAPLIPEKTGRKASGIQLHLICYPHDDTALIARVTNIVDERARTGQPATPHQVADHLRIWYPKVAISVREPFADLWGSQGPTWYVYRDGSILPDRRTDATSV